MKAFFVDTSSTKIVLAIIEDNKLLSFIEEDNNNLLSERIFPLINTLFNKANNTVNSINKIFVVNGPGSFTGVRIGVTIAKTMAWALNIPIIPISSLEVLASTETSSDYLIPYIDARRGFVYAGIYDKDLKLIKEDNYTTLDKLISFIPDNSKFILVGYTDVNLNLNKIYPKINVIKVINKHENDKKVNPHLLKPNYLKLTEAEKNLNKEI